MQQLGSMRPLQEGGRALLQRRSQIPLITPATSKQKLGFDVARRSLTFGMMESDK